MKLIIVKRTKLATFSLLRSKFARDPDVWVFLDRRTGQHPIVEAGRERRRLNKSSERDYVVVYTPGDRIELPSRDTVDGIGNDGRGAVEHDRTWSWWER